MLGFFSNEQAKRRSLKINRQFYNLLFKVIASCCGLNNKTEINNQVTAASGQCSDFGINASAPFNFFYFIYNVGFSPTASPVFTEGKIL